MPKAHPGQLIYAVLLVVVVAFGIFYPVVLLQSEIRNAQIAYDREPVTIHNDESGRVESNPLKDAAFARMVALERSFPDVLGECRSTLLEVTGLTIIGYVIYRLIGEHYDS